MENRNCRVLLEKLPDSTATDCTSSRTFGRFTLRPNPIASQYKLTNQTTISSAKRTRRSPIGSEQKNLTEIVPAKRNKRKNTIDRENLGNSTALSGTETSSEKMSNAISTNQDLMKKIFDLHNLLIEKKDEMISMQKVFNDDFQKSMQQDAEIEHLKQRLKSLQEKSIVGNLIDLDNEQEQSDEVIEVDEIENTDSPQFQEWTPLK